jgi:hypothetical protein
LIPFRHGLGRGVYSRQFSQILSVTNEGRSEESTGPLEIALIRRGCNGYSGLSVLFVLSLNAMAYVQVAGLLGFHVFAVLIGIFSATVG